MLNAENNRDFEARIRDAAQRSLDKEVAAFDALDPDAAAVSAKTERRILRAIHTLRTPRTHRTRLRRIAACAAILLSLTVAALLCVEPIRAPYGISSLSGTRIMSSCAWVRTRMHRPSSKR